MSSIEVSELHEVDSGMSRGTIRLFLLVEGASFLLASLVHRGLLVSHYEHAEAAIAESAIAALVLLGLALTWVASAWTREIGIVAQALALLGTLVGVFTIVIGVGPRTAPDVAYHVSIIVVLIWGLAYAIGRFPWRTRQPA